jgi:hypothetical protein
MHILESKQIIALQVLHMSNIMVLRRGLIVPRRTKSSYYSEQMFENIIQNRHWRYSTAALHEETHMPIGSMILEIDFAKNLYNIGGFRKIHSS